MTEMKMTEMFQENGQYGVKDAMGEVIVPAMFDSIPMVLSEEMKDCTIPVVKDGKYGLVKPDGKGTMVVACEYDNIHFYNCYYYAVKDGKYGLYGMGCGEEILPVMADKIYEPWNDLVVYELDGKFGFSMRLSGIVTDAVYDGYDVEENDDLSVTLNGKRGYLDETGSFTEDPDNAWFHAGI